MRERATTTPDCLCGLPHTVEYVHDRSVAVEQVPLTLHSELPLPAEPGEPAVVAPVVDGSEQLTDQAALRTARGQGP
jgi:hypothetical protein